MIGLALTVLLVGIALLLIGAFVHVAHFLLWLGIVIAVVGAVLWLFHGVSGRSRTV